MTIVVSVANGDDLALLLDSVAVGVPPSDSVEVVVVVAATSDTEAGGQTTRAFPFELRVERTPGTSAGAMRNAGVAAARGDVIWLVDSRALVTGAAFARHRDHDRAGPEVLIGPCPVPSGDPEAADTTWWYQYRDRRLGDLGEITDARDCSFANMSARRSLLRSAGFDEGYRTAALSDVDLGMRLLDAGVRIAFDRDAGLPVARRGPHPWQSSAAAGADRVRFLQRRSDRMPTVFRATPGRLERVLRRWAPSSAGRRVAPMMEGSARSMAALIRRNPSRRGHGTILYLADTLSTYGGVMTELASSDATGEVGRALRASLDTSFVPRGRVVRWWQERVADRVRLATLPWRIHHVHGPRSIERRADELLAVTTVRNGKFHLRSFLEHHRRLGIAHFLVLDNGSTDGTIEFLCAQPDVSLFRTSVPYRTYENVMKRYMVREHSTGKWNLFVDIDELFDYPGSESLPVDDLLTYLTEHGYTAVVAQMVDMFADGPLADSPTEPVDLRSAFPYFDITDISKQPYWYDDEPESPLKSHHGGIRRTIFGSNNGLSKAALTFVDDRIEIFAAWHHARNARFADITCALLHFPFNRDFYEKSEEAARTYRYGIGASHEYRAYWAVLRDDPKLSLRRPTAQRFRDVQQLVDLGFLQVSDQYRCWMLDHVRDPR
jgi:GT2 family glycosyltransferase